jgi:hypothetical protein
MPWGELDVRSGKFRHFLKQYRLPYVHPQKGITALDKNLFKDRTKEIVTIETENYTTVFSRPLISLCQPNFI